MVSPPINRTELINLILPFVCIITSIFTFVKSRCLISFITSFSGIRLLLNINSETIEKSTRNNMDASENLILYMNWSKRDRLMSIVNQFSALLLLGDAISAEVRNKLAIEINDLVSMLIDLPLSSKQIVDVDQTELVFEISRLKRNETVERLIKNKDFAFSYSDSLSNESKKALADENKILIQTLLNLSIKPLETGQTCELINLASATTKSDGQLNKGETKDIYRLKESDARSKAEINNLKQKLKLLEESDLNRNKRIAVLEENISSLAQDSDSTPKIEFTFEIDNAKELLTVGTYRKSSIFYCRNIPWYLSVQSRLINGVRNIGLYLNCDYKNERRKWSIETSYLLSLVSQISSVPNKTEKLIKYKFEEAGGRGLANFIYPQSVLINPEEGYVKDGTIILQIELEAEQMIKEK